MISRKEAQHKLVQLAPRLSRPARARLLGILNDEARLEQRDTWYDREALDYVLWLEQRLAAKHLAYLAPDQVNGLWGQSTTEALAKLAQVYELDFDGALTASLLQALLDGQKSAKDDSALVLNNYASLRQQVLALGFHWDDREHYLNMIGLRGYIHPQGTVENLPDIYNDSLVLAWKDSSGQQVLPFLASTDPGRYYYQMHRLNPLGCAWLKAGQYLYQRGIHRYYPALVQAGPVTVCRIDASGQPQAGDPEQTGWFGINIHAGTGGPQIYNASAGCQVIQSAGIRGWQWLRFWKQVSLAPNRTFYYTLIEPDSAA